MTARSFVLAVVAALVARVVADLITYHINDMWAPRGWR